MERLIHSVILHLYSGLGTRSIMRCRKQLSRESHEVLLLVWSNPHQVFSQHGPFELHINNHKSHNTIYILIFTKYTRSTIFMFSTICTLLKSYLTLPCLLVFKILFSFHLYFSLNPNFESYLKPYLLYLYYSLNPNFEPHIHSIFII